MWEASLRYVDPLTGLRDRLSRYGPTRAAVVEALDEARARLRAHRAPRDEPITLAAFLHAWLEDVVKPTLRPATYRSYRSALETHVVAGKLGRMTLRDLSPLVLQRVLVAGAKPSRARSIALVALRRALDQAVSYGFIASNPAATLATSRTPRRELRHLTLAQVQSFLAAARADRLFALYYLAIDTGMRQGELLALRWSDVDLDGGTIRVTRSLDNHTRVVGPVKTASSRRTIALGPGAVAVLCEHRDRSCGPLLFASAGGQPLSPQNVRNRSFLPLQRAAGIDPPIRFHDLRHTAATLMLEAGVHPKVVSERLGHARVAFTMDVYQHVMPTLQRDAAAAISRILAEPKGGSNGGTGQVAPRRAESRKRKNP